MILTLCRAENCWRAGGRALVAYIAEHFAIAWDETTSDGTLTLRGAYCIGLCKGAPCGAANGTNVVRLTPARLGALIAKESK